MEPSGWLVHWVLFKCFFFSYFQMIKCFFSGWLLLTEPCCLLKNHFRTSQQLCQVASLKSLEHHIKLLLSSTSTHFNCLLNMTITRHLTLITVDAIFASLAGFTCCSTETLVTLADTCPISPIKTHTICKARLTLRPGTRLTVLSKKPTAALVHLKERDSV